MITRAFRILTINNQPCLLCLLCDRWSYNPHDIAHRYCGWCHVFLRDVPEDYQRPRLHYQGVMVESNEGDMG